MHHRPRERSFVRTARDEPGHRPSVRFAGQADVKSFRSEATIGADSERLGRTDTSFVSDLVDRQEEGDRKSFDQSIFKNQSEHASAILTPTFAFLMSSCHS